MKNGTLIVSRIEKQFDFIKNEFSKMGFDDITITGADRDALLNIINDTKPKVMILGSNFFKCSTPYMTRIINKNFPTLNIAAITTTEYPPSLAMYFIINGAKSYISFWDDPIHFQNGMKEIQKGKAFISNVVRQRIANSEYYPEPKGNITQRHIEVMRCTCNGFTEVETGKNLWISDRTVERHKTEILRNLHLRNDKEIIRAALDMGFVKNEELIFFGDNYELHPYPVGKRTGRKTK